jgi:predicted TIM-barrel enzyme
MNKKIFLVALHVWKNMNAVREQAAIIANSGAHGMLLVNNGLEVLSDPNDYPNLLDMALEIKKLYPDLLIGINCLDLSFMEAIFRMSNKLDILWTDKGGVMESAAGDSAFVTDQLDAALKVFGPDYYGSEIFKYQPAPKNPMLVAQTAANHFTTLITSGEKTGTEPDVEKIKQIRKWIGPEKRLGIASGMSAENVELFLPYADTFIVASSLNLIENGKPNFFKYDARKIQDFRKKIDAYRAA